MCRVPIRRGRADHGWREEREWIEDGLDAVPLRDAVDVDLSIDPESGGVVVDHPDVDIDVTVGEFATED